MKKLLFFNQIPLAGNKKEYSVDEKLKYVGLNTGNIVYVGALKNQVLYDKEIWFSESVIEDKNNLIGIIPCANMIGVYDVCTEIWGEYIKKWDIPITLIGLGAQSTKELNTPKKLVNALPKEKIAALKRISGQAISLGIRGEFTAECLELMGIYNYRIIGCPSLYREMKDNFRPIDFPSKKKCVINLLPYSALASKILNMGMTNNAKWIMQESSEMPKTFLENKEIEFRHIATRFPDSNISVNVLESYMRANSKIFWDMDEWSAYLQKEKFTFSFGSRFHGNVMSLLNGIPALWITHDSRTQELVDTFSLPYITNKELCLIKNIDELIQYCNYDLFYKKYKIMFNEYLHFLEENEIPHI